MVEHQLGWVVVHQFDDFLLLSWGLDPVYWEFEVVLVEFGEYKSGFPTIEKASKTRHSVRRQYSTILTLSLPLTTPNNSLLITTPQEPNLLNLFLKHHPIPHLLPFPHPTIFNKPTTFNRPPCCCLNLILPYYWMFQIHFKKLLQLCVIPVKGMVDQGQLGNVGRGVKWDWCEWW